MSPKRYESVSVERSSPRRVTAPVRQLMQCSAVISGSVLEGILRWQVDAVLRAAVECAIRLVVRDVRARVLQDLLARLDGFETGVLLGRVGRNALDLLGVEYRVHAVDEPRFLGIRAVPLAVLAFPPPSAGMAVSCPKLALTSQYSICVPFSPRRPAIRYRTPACTSSTSGLRSRVVGQWPSNGSRCRPGMLSRWLD